MDSDYKHKYYKYKTKYLDAKKGGVSKTVFIGNFEHKDKKLIKHLFQKRGYTITSQWSPDNKDQHTIYNATPRKIRWKDIHKECRLINHVPWNSFMSHKRRFINLFKNRSDYVPFTFELKNPLYIKQQVEEYNKSKIKNFGKYLWIVKPDDRFAGQDICILTGDELLDPLNNERFFDKIVQKYLEEPLLLEDCKIDLRMYLLFTQDNELYLYPKYIVRTSSSKYDIKCKDLYKHVTNVGVQTKSSSYCSEKHILSSDQLIAKFSGYDKEELTKIPQKVSKMMISLFDDVKDLIGMYKKYEDRYFELFGIDIILDKEYNPYLMEININSDVQWDSKVADEMCTKMLDDVFSLTVDRVFDNKTSNTDFMLLKKY
jgi:hypothetical protein